MFWDTKDPPSHNIEILLESPDTKVEVFLEEDNIIQECKTLKKNIVNYFTRPDVVRRMIELITTEPPEEVPISERFRHANVACEILTMGLPSLDEKLLADTDTLNMLYSYLENEPPLNPLLASFFSKTFSMLFIKKSEQDWFLYQQTCLKLLEYLKTKSNFLDLICKHFSTPIVPDLIMEMMQNIEGGQLKRSLFEWLNEERLVEKLIEIIGDPAQSEIHANVADFLCDLIHQGRTMRQDIDNFEPVFGGSDPILKKIESATTLFALFNVILQPNALESAIVSGITVVLKIIKLVKVTDERNMERFLCIIARESEIHNEFLTTVIRVIEPQLKHFNELLKNPPKKSDIITSAAHLSPPFGMARLQICRLFTELLETKNEEIANAICETDFLDVLLSLFKEYSWNNFLHSEVEKCLHTIFPYPSLPPKSKSNNNPTQLNDGSKDNPSTNANAKANIDNSNPKLNSNTNPKDQQEHFLDSVFDNFNIVLQDSNEVKTTVSAPSAIQTYAIVKCKILSKLLECWKANKDMESAERGRRLGYMGHLINIFKHITECISQAEHIGALIESNLQDDNERELWQTIVNSSNGELLKALSVQTKLLANHEPCEYNVSLDFFTDNNISDAFNGLCTLMDSSDANVIFTLDYNTQQDDHDFDDDDGDDDNFNNIDNENNDGKDKDQRNDDVKNALNLFQFGRSNDDDEGDEDDNVATSFEGDGDLSFYDESHPNPFAEDPWETKPEFDNMMRGLFDKKGVKNTNIDKAFADFEAMCYNYSSITSADDSTANAIEPTTLTEISSEEYDNNANVEKSSSWSGDFTSFQMPKKDTQFSSNFLDDYEDDEGVWTKPFGASATTLTAEQIKSQSEEAINETDFCKIDFIANGPCGLEEADRKPEETSSNQLNNSIEDNTLVEQTAEDITSNNKDETIKEINNEFNLKEEEKTKHKTHTPDTNNIEIVNPTTTNKMTNAATAGEEISTDTSVTATIT